MNLASTEKKKNTCVQTEFEFIELNSRRRCSGGYSGHMPILSFQVKMALQQEGFDRKKRGYRDINEIDINMNDPLFTKQWYLVSTSVLFLPFLILRLRIKKNAFLFPRFSVGCQPASDSMNLSVPLICIDFLSAPMRHVL